MQHCVSELLNLLVQEAVHSAVLIPLLLEHEGPSHGVLFVLNGVNFIDYFT